MPSKPCATCNPKVLYVSLDVTDEYGHTGRYDHYLMAAHADDRIISMLWQQAQSDPFYRDRTTFVIATDHGRGMGDHWTDHGAITERSGETWLAAFGPGHSPSGGSRRQRTVPEHTDSGHHRLSARRDISAGRTGGRAAALLRGVSFYSYFRTRRDSTS